MRRIEPRPLQRLLRIALLIGVGALAARGQGPIITEFMASNSGYLRDEDGESPDWLEIHNPGPAPLFLGGWGLSDDAAELHKWRCPNITLEPGAYLLVFASGKDRAVAGSPLHTNFRLDGAGDFLALTAPGQTRPAWAYAPAFPAQRANVSFGLAMETARLVGAEETVQFRLPVDDSLGRTWTEPEFVPDAQWAAALQPVGFYVGEEGGEVPAAVAYWGLDGALGDGSGHGNDASYEGAADPVFGAGFDGRAGGALTLHGGDYLDITHASRLPIYQHSAYTVAMWVKGLPQADKRVYSEGSGSNRSALFTIGTDNTGRTGAVDIFIRTASGSAVVNHAKSAGIAFDGSWHHIAWVDRAGAAELYIDGALDPTSFAYAKQGLPLDITSLGAVLRDDACCFFEGSIDEAAVWDVALAPEQIAALVTGQSPGGGNPYQDLIATDLGTALHQVNSTLFLRFPFVLEAPFQYDSLRLRVRYDDGFVACLNGAEVARRNAPAGPGPAWNAAAPLCRESYQARAWEEIDLSAHAGLLRPGANVLTLHGLNCAPGDVSFLAAAELAGSSASGLAMRYFTAPTPERPNGDGFAGLTADPASSVRRGFFAAPFEVRLSSATPGATIRYTLDQSAPAVTAGEIYTGPLRVSGTTTLRAIAFKDGLLPSDAITQTYIFLDDVLRQPANPAGYPASWQGWPADYAMDPEICVEQESPHFAPTLKEDLRSLLVCSLVIDRDDLMGPVRGIYTHTLSRGSAWERPASVEFFYPDGSALDLQVNCGVRLQGGSSARPGEGKHAFRLLFKGAYGPTELAAPLFPDSAAERFDTLVLRCFSTDSWHFKDGGSRYRRWDSQFIRDLWMKDSQLAMGHLSGHNIYVHLYLNGMYWGVYNVAERPDDTFQALYQGGAPEAWDIVKDSSELFRGRWDDWRAMFDLANAGLDDQARYQRIQGNDSDGTRNTAYPVLLDVDALIDYMILHLFACSEDWPHHNWYAARDRTGASGGWRFQVWDQEIVMDFVFRNRIDVSDDNSPARLYARLRANPEFRLRFADRVQKHLFNGGALTVAECQERWRARADQIDRAVVAESARWGDYRLDVSDPSHSPAELYTREGHWLVEKDKVLFQYIPESHRLALERFRAGGLYPVIDAPVVEPAPGWVAPGSSLSFMAGRGSVYYTLDGSDPRLPGGAIAPGARVADAAIPIPSLLHVKARAFDGEWSALVDAEYRADIPLRITELMYHPPAPGPQSAFDADDFEFIELENVGPQAIDLNGFRITGGVELAFGPRPPLLAPGGIILVVRNLTAFLERYSGRRGFVVGVYEGNLSNGGDRVVLEGAAGETVLDFAYQDGWHPITDGGGHSLVAVDPQGLPSLWQLASGWAPSRDPGGSPGTREPPEQRSSGWEGF